MVEAQTLHADIPFEATDLVLSNDHTKTKVPSDIKVSGLLEIKKSVETAIDLVKTKQGDAKVILVGGGNIVVTGEIAGVGEVIRPKHLEVANAIGAAVRIPNPKRTRSDSATLDWQNKWHSRHHCCTRTRH